MKKAIFLLVLLSCTLTFAQSKGSKVGFIDMDYILNKVSSYAEAKNQLELKANTWKQEIEVRKGEISDLKKQLNSEKALLTKELIEEREEEISFLEQELLAFQEKKFGAQGDLIVQKTVLVKPIQDQVFTIIQDIAEQKKFDFIFDKSSDLSIIFANKAFDISELVIRQLNRAEKREELTKKQLKEQEAREAKEDMTDANPDLAARQAALDEKKAAREQAVAERNAARQKAIEERKKLAEEKRQQAIDARNGKKTGTDVDKPSSEKPSDVNSDDEKTTEEVEKKTETATQTADEKRKQLEAERQQKIEQRKKELEERRKKILEEREAAKKAREEEQNKTKEENN